MFVYDGKLTSHIVSKHTKKQTNKKQIVYANLLFKVTHCCATVRVVIQQ